MSLKEKKYKRNHPRNQRVYFASPQRKQIRESLYNKLYLFVIDQGSSINIKDRLWAVHLIDHKLRELKLKEKKP